MPWRKPGEGRLAGGHSSLLPLAIWCFFILFPPALAAQTTGIPAAGQSSTGPQEGVHLTGSLSTTYRLEAAPGADGALLDHRLSEAALLDLQFLPAGVVSIHVSADGRAVLGAGAAWPLVDLADAWPGQVSGSLSEAYLDINGLTRYLRQIRVGRQASLRSDPFTFDGISAVLALGDVLSLTAFGGVGVHFYELDWTWGSDFTAGAGADLHPLPFTRLSADYAYIRDSRISYLGTGQSNHLMSFRVWQDLFSVVKLTGELRLIDFSPGDLRVGISTSFPSIGLSTAASYYVQLVTLAELSNELSGFYDVVGETIPYQTAELSVSERLGGHVGIRAGGLVRGLLYGAAESEFNRQYWKISVGLDLIDLFAPGLSVSIPGEIWQTDGNQYWATGIGVRYQGASGLNRLTLEAGSYFSLFKYDSFALEGERSNTQTYYARARIPIGSKLTIQARYELEWSDSILHTLYIGVRSDF